MVSQAELRQRTRASLLRQRQAALRQRQPISFQNQELIKQEQQKQNQIQGEILQTQQEIKNLEQRQLKEGGSPVIAVKIAELSDKINALKRGASLSQAEEIAAASQRSGLQGIKLSNLASMGIDVRALRKGQLDINKLSSKQVDALERQGLIERTSVNNLNQPIDPRGIGSTVIDGRPGILIRQDSPNIDPRTGKPFGTVKEFQEPSLLSKGVFGIKSGLGIAKEKAERLLDPPKQAYIQTDNVIDSQRLKIAGVDPTPANIKALRDLDRGIKTDADLLLLGAGATPSAIVSRVSPLLESDISTEFFGTVERIPQGSKSKVFSVSRAGKAEGFSVSGGTTKTLAEDLAFAESRGFGYQITPKGELAGLNPFTSFSRIDKLGKARAIRNLRNPNLRVSAEMGDGSLVNIQRAVRDLKNKRTFIDRDKVALISKKVGDSKNSYYIFSGGKPILRINKRTGEITYIIKNPNISGKLLEVVDDVGQKGVNILRPNPNIKKTPLSLTFQEQQSLQGVIGSAVQQSQKEALRLAQAIDRASLQRSLVQRGLVSPGIAINPVVQRETVRTQRNVQKNQIMVETSRLKNNLRKEVTQFKTLQSQQLNDLRINYAKEKQSLNRLLSDRLRKGVDVTQIDSLINNQRNRLRNAYVDYIRFREAQGNIQRDLITQASRISQRIALRQKQRLKQLNDNLRNPSNLEPQKIPGTPKIPIIPDLDSGKVKRKKLPKPFSKKGNVQAFVKTSPSSKNRFRKVGTPTTLKKASRSLYNRLDKTISATGYLKKDGKIIRPKTLPKSFRPSRNPKLKGFIVEKRKYRINSPGEKRALKKVKPLIKMKKIK